MRPHFPENEYRRDRDARPHSKARDSSRGRRDDDDKDRTRRFDRDDRDRPIRGVDHYSPPRDRDDDPRRWRDDGKREDRVRSQRDRDRDNRWQTTEERDSRLKRRDRKNVDDGKDKDRRDDRDKDREKEPAWMETYVPDTSGGILGGKTGEMDSIQAWKKDMKEKEEKDKAAATKDLPPGPQPDTPGQAKPPMDDTELLRMIERGANKKAQQEVAQDTHGPAPTLSK